MRAFIACLATETNTFTSFPTGMGAFEEYGVVRDASTSGTSVSSPVLGLLRARAEAEGAEVVESISAFAQPANKTVGRVYEALRDMILDDLRAAGEVDMIFLMLHGAMVAEGCDDCEGDVISRVRALAPRAAIGVELDLHCHLTEAMVREADFVIACKEYPHIDFPERAAEMFDVCNRIRKGGPAPVAALLDTRLIGIYPTFEPPMRDIVADLRAMEQRPGIVSASIGHGFPWADVADVGTRVLVYADDAERAGTAALEIAEGLYAQRRALLPGYPDIEASLDRAASLPGRVVVGDFADNAGGGAPSDSTFFLRAMMERDLQDAAVGCIYDPCVARIAADAGIGARIDVRLGGKTGAVSGDPIDLSVEVMGLSTDARQDMLGASTGMGLVVWLRHRGIDIAVNTVRSQTFHPDVFRSCGIDLDGKRLIVVKSSSHYEAGFRPIADHLWHAKGPGAMTLDFASLPYTKRDRDWFPLIDDPWAARGVPAPTLFAPRAAS